MVPNRATHHIFPLTDWISTYFRLQTVNTQEYTSNTQGYQILSGPHILIYGLNTEMCQHLPVYFRIHSMNENYMVRSNSVFLAIFRDEHSSKWCWPNTQSEEVIYSIWMIKQPSLFWQQLKCWLDKCLKYKIRYTPK